MSTYGKRYDVVVVGAGHAGCEAALAAARMGCSTLLLNMNLDAVAEMSCNPAIGGLAKGHLVKEIDALGGEMARAIDATGIQFRILNTKKGPAVRASRAQADRRAYAAYMKGVVERQTCLDLKHGVVVSLLCDSGRIRGVETAEGLRFESRTVVLTTGTFMRGLIHVGMRNYPGGRAGEPPSLGVSDQLRAIGLRVGRLKTGTPARLNSRSINFEILEEQRGDLDPKPFSQDTDAITNPQVSCYITYTNERTHDLIRSGLDRSPLYSGVIEGVGPRYCPSIEDKVVRFPEKERHQIFLEPEGLQTAEVYPNGVSTSLPPDVQQAFLRTIPGLEDVEIMRPGYAIEYDYIDPIQLYASLEVKEMPGLYHAGQVNGTSGYEEAAAQGLVAGINAALAVKGEGPFVVGRDQGYVGVLVDDLITLGTVEPYRMFTSRAEYRLLLREDNADQRLTPEGYRLGLITEKRWRSYSEKTEAIEKGRGHIRETRISPSNSTVIDALGIGPLKNGVSLEEVLRRPDVEIEDIARIDTTVAALGADVLEQISIDTKYEGYIRRQVEQVEVLRKNEETTIPEGFDYEGLSGLSLEVTEKLKKVRPRTLAQASRIPGVTPAAIAILAVLLKRGGR